MIVRKCHVFGVHLSVLLRTGIVGNAINYLMLYCIDIFCIIWPLGVILLHGFHVVLRCNSKTSKDAASLIGSSIVTVFAQFSDIKLIDDTILLFTYMPIRTKWLTLCCNKALNRTETGATANAIYPILHQSKRSMSFVFQIHQSPVNPLAHDPSEILQSIRFQSQFKTVFDFLLYHFSRSQSNSYTHT